MSDDKCLQFEPNNFVTPVMIYLSGEMDKEAVTNMTIVRSLKEIISENIMEKANFKS